MVSFLHPDPFDLFSSGDLGLTMHEVTEDDDEFEQCRVCRGDLMPQLLWIKTDDDFGISCSRYRLHCPECGHVEKEYEVLD